MISLDQVLLLEQKVENAVAKIAQLNAENAALRRKCVELTNALSAKTEQFSSFKSDQNKIEEGILKALERLNTVENAVHSEVTSSTIENVTSDTTNQLFQEDYNTDNTSFQNQILEQETSTENNFEDIPLNDFQNDVIEDEELKNLLEENNITAISKDSIGIRVGIVNTKGTQDLLKVKNYLPLMAENMPLKELYEQNISSEDDNLQTMVDADIVSLRGDEGSYRGGITIAQNLPNNDKLSLTIGGGRRNVYHRQIRLITSEDAKEKMQKRLNATLNPELHKFYNDEADHWFTVGHENGHSLGPKSGTEGLGKYKSIIEENKADMISLAMVDILTEAGMYTKEQRDQIILTYAVDNMMMSKPTMSQAHRVRSVMQNYYFIKEGTITISPEGILDVNMEKMVPTAKKMLEEIIRVQLSGDFETGEKYVLDNFIWTPEMDKMAENQVNNNEEQLDENHLISIRKEKLRDLQAQGKDPFQINLIIIFEHNPASQRKLEGKEL